MNDRIKLYPENKPENDSACFVFYDEKDNGIVRIDAAVYSNGAFLVYNFVGEIAIPNVVAYIEADDDIIDLENLWNK